MIYDQASINCGGTAGLPISRDSNLDLALCPFELLATVAIGRIDCAFPSPSMLGVAQVRVQLGL